MFFPFISKIGQTIDMLLIKLLDTLHLCMKFSTAKSEIYIHRFFRIMLAHLKSIV